MIPGLGRSPGEGKGYSLQYSGLENSMDCIVYGVTKSQRQLGNFHFQSHTHTHIFTYIHMGFPGGTVVKNLPASAGDAGDLGSVPGWGRSPGGGNDNLTPVFLPGESHGQRSLVGYSPWRHEESDAAE